MARAPPDVIESFVEALQNNGKTVAITADGTNAAPALKRANIGISMGISGTDICKEASDVIIMDDNLATVANLMLASRNITWILRRFLQFSITANLSTFLIVFISVLSTGSSPFQPMHLIWLNFIVDWFAVLFFAIAHPEPELKHTAPFTKQDKLISSRMIKHILLKSAWMCIVTLSLIHLG